MSVTEEVWTLAKEIDPLRLVVFILLSIAVVTIIIYYTKFQKVAKEAIAEFDAPILGKAYVPKRLVSLFLISYSVTWFILWLFGVMSHVADPGWSFRIFIFVSFFASVGAATADILK